MYELSAMVLYFSMIFLIGALFSSKKLSSSEFILGNRSLNYWVTALAAHASDMSNWLFMAFPSMIFLYGLDKIWIAVGLISCMFLNWNFVAKKIRVETEALGSLTFFSYLSDRFQDTTGALRITAAFICFVFYTVYVSVGLMGLGVVVHSLFPISYEWAIFIGICITIPYVLIGGYKTLAWIDLFQGLFLMAIILFVPFFLLGKIGGIAKIQEVLIQQGRPKLHIPAFSLQALLTMLGWGLGYFGQPTIVTKFMGIKNTSEIAKSQMIGMTWMILSLGAATLVGLIGIPFFEKGLSNPEMVFISLVQNSFSPFLIGLILCAIFAASINVMSSQILVLCSTWTEDIYKKILNPSASSQKQLLVSRIGAIVIALVSLFIAYYKISTVYTLVLYAWSGLGAAFGPLLIFSLYSKKKDIRIAWAGILSGSASSAIWPWINSFFAYPIDPIIIGCLCSFSSIWIVSILSQRSRLQRHCP
jgi:sodium/proline symporter